MSPNTRPRGIDWAIGFLVVALFAAGVAALWGQDIARLFGSAEPTTATTPAPAPPSGRPAGPF